MTAVTRRPFDQMVHILQTKAKRVSVWKLLHLQTLTRYCQSYRQSAKAVHVTRKWCSQRRRAVPSVLGAEKESSLMGKPKRSPRQRCSCRTRSHVLEKTMHRCFSHHRLVSQTEKFQRGSHIPQPQTLLHYDPWLPISRKRG